MPNGTALWQVGDSSQQNGRFEVNIPKQKEYIRTKQRNYSESIKIERFHVVLMVGLAWKIVFGDVAGNTHAILQCGWNPLNRGCLVHPDIEKTKPHNYEGDRNRTDSLEVRTTIRAETDRQVCHQDNEDDVLCCNGSLCGMPAASLLGPSDTHRCYSCKGRMHGGIFCAVFENDDDYSGKMYCKKCGRPGDGVVNSCITDRSSSNYNKAS